MKNRDGLPTPNKDDVEFDGAAIGGKSRGFKAIIVAVWVIVVISAIVAFVYYQKQQANVDNADEVKKTDTHSQSQVDETIFHELDEMLVNLDSKDKTPHFLKIKITLEMSKNEDLKMVQKMMPKINDALLVYLRTLRFSDMHGSIALYRLREEMMFRINKIIYPAQLTDILFRDILAQ